LSAAAPAVTAPVRSGVERTTDPAAERTTSSLRRWLLAALGVLLVGVGAVGAVVPGLPTTVFLLGACWCFARSCPALERWLRESPFLGGYLKMARDGMPRRAKVVTIAAIWAATTFSVMGPLSESPDLARVALMGLAAVGTWAVARLVPGSRRTA